MNEYIKTQNAIIQRHADTIKSALRSRASMSADSFRVKARPGINRKTTAIDKIKISFERHGVFVEKGVGRGRGINSGKTKPNEWFNPVIMEKVPQLADELGENTANMLLKTLIR